MHMGARRACFSVQSTNFHTRREYPPHLSFCFQLLEWNFEVFRHKQRLGADWEFLDASILVWSQARGASREDWSRLNTGTYTVYSENWPCPSLATN